MREYIKNLEFFMLHKIDLVYLYEVVISNIFVHTFSNYERF